MGGKQRIAKQIADYLNLIRLGRPYWEPFVGSANVIVRMDGDRTGTDIHTDLIMLLKSVQESKEELPEIVTEADYHAAKNMEPCAYRGFVGFGCSFGGKWFGGYARSGDRNYAKNAKNSLLKKQAGLQGVKLYTVDYRALHPEDYLIYCDPPYRNTTRYSNPFNHDEFWRVMGEWSIANTVIVSEYEAPAPWQCVLEMPTKIDMHVKDGRQLRTERLFAM